MSRCGASARLFSPGWKSQKPRARESAWVLEGHGLRKPIDPWEKWQHRTASVSPIRHNWACICRTLTKIYPKISSTSHDRVTGTYLTHPLSINWSKHTMTRGLPGIKPDKNIWVFVFGCWTTGRKWGERHNTLSSLPEGILWTMVQWEGAHTPLAHWSMEAENRIQSC